MRVSRRKRDGRIIEAQSGSGDLDVLMKNAIAAGYLADEIEVLDMNDAAFKDAMAAQVLLDRDADPKYQRQKALTDDADFKDLFNRIQTATPAQIKAYVQNNVTDLASAKLLMAKMLLLLGKQ